MSGGLCIRIKAGIVQYPELARAELTLKSFCLYYDSYSTGGSHGYKVHLVWARYTGTGYRRL